MDNDTRTGVTSSYKENFSSKEAVAGTDPEINQGGWLAQVSS